MSRRAVVLVVIFVLLLGLRVAYGQARESKLPPQLAVMKGELARNFETLKKEEAPPYYISYSIDDVRTQTVAATFGATRRKDDSASAVLSIDVRVGSAKLDNTHEIRGDRYGRYRSVFGAAAEAPLHEAPDALKVMLWQGTDKAYKDAVENLARVKTDKNITVAEEDKSDDFSAVESHVSVDKPLAISADLKKWEDKVRKYTAPFRARPYILEGDAYFQSEVRNNYFVNTEGTTLLAPVNYMRLQIRAVAKADDGMELPLYLSYFGYSEGDLPDDARVLADVQGMIENLAALRQAPVVDPYTGPAILSGSASGVFFHEILGHRMEGHRQKSAEEGQTFKKKVNEKILPEFISVVFDPTIKDLDGAKLSGFYKFDDQGTQAQKVVSVDNGVLKAFLMSRSPIEGFPASNGHARCQPGLKPVSRQSNLVVLSKNQVPEDQLRLKLIESCKAQGKPYGLVFKEIAGGMTMTGRTAPNAFTVLPLLVYRVYVDGRPDEMVRGVDLIGTPLTTFEKILATGEKREVFNGICGAESGAVPVAAVSPSILVSQIEVQKKEKSQEKPPILPPPSVSE